MKTFCDGDIYILPPPPRVVCVVKLQLISKTQWTPVIPVLPSPDFIIG